VGDIIPFDFEGQAVRAMEIEGQPWFVGKDVAERLGYADTTNALKQHCNWVVKHHPIIDALGRTQEVRILSEADVLRLILSSKLPSAVKFERWVFEEVLPAIRKSGAYMVAAPTETPEELAVRALLVLQRPSSGRRPSLPRCCPRRMRWTGLPRRMAAFRSRQPPRRFRSVPKTC